MKIRFLEDWPRIEDKEGPFTLFCVGVSDGSTVGEIITVRSKEEPCEAFVQIFAKPANSSTGTLLCCDHYRSCAEAATAMTSSGIEIAGNSAAYAYAKRCIEAKKAELLTPAWLLLLRALPVYPKIARERLTVSFYLGGCRNPSERMTMSPEDTRRDLCRLITSFVDETPQGHAVRIFCCGSIRQPVVELIAVNGAAFSNHAIESAVQGRRTLIVDPEFAPNNLLSISSLADRLLREFESDVCAGRFSFENGRYRESSEEERDFIADSVT